MKNQYSDEYVRRTVTHYGRMVDEICALRIERDICNCHIKLLERKLKSLGIDPTEWQQFALLPR